jgi:hypothetical protein
MPDEAREVIFPQGVPIVESRTPAEVQQPETTTTVAPRVGRPVEPDALSTDAEGGLRSEDASIQEQARQARIPEAGENLLGPPD